jgi:hypothetical protein
MRIFLCGDVMLGRGVDQILPHPCGPELYESYVESAVDYVRLAEHVNGPIPRNVDFSYVWGAALEELAHRRPDARVINLETSITRNAAYEPKGINYRVSPENAACLAMAPVHWAAGSDGETNFGTTSVAAPHDVSSRVAKYSFTARLDLAGSRSLRQSPPAIERCLLASAWIRLASTAKPSPPTSSAAMHVSTTRSNICRKTPPWRKRSWRARENAE